MEDDDLGKGRAKMSVDVQRRVSSLKDFTDFIRSAISSFLQEKKNAFILDNKQFYSLKEYF